MNEIECPECHKKTAKRVKMVEAGTMKILDYGFYCTECGYTPDDG